jgi:hypothetical protein
MDNGGETTFYLVDVQLETDTKDTKVEPDDIPDFEVDEATLTLPHLKGSGQVYDSFIAYNVDPEFKAIALAYANDLSKLQKNPDALIENYSGYTKLISQYRERYSAPEFSMSESDKKAWIADRFFGTDTYMSNIEKHYTMNLNNANHKSKQCQVFTFYSNILTCKDFHTNKSLHVRTKIKSQSTLNKAMMKYR